MDGGTSNLRAPMWGEEARAQRPLPLSPGLRSTGPEAGSTGIEPLERMLEMARVLADGLSRAPHDDRSADGVRLARALTLNVVDLLEGARPR